MFKRPSLQELESLRKRDERVCSGERGIVDGDEGVDVCVGGEEAEGGFPGEGGDGVEGEEHGFLGKVEAWGL